MSEIASPLVVHPMLGAGALLGVLAVVLAVRAPAQRGLLLGAATMTGLVLFDRAMSGATLSQSVAVTVAIVLFVARVPPRRDATVALTSGLVIAAVAGVTLTIEPAPVWPRLGLVVAIAAGVSLRAVQLHGLSLGTAAIAAAAIGGVLAFAEAWTFAFHLVLLPAAVVVFAADRQGGPALSWRDGLIAGQAGVVGALVAGLFAGAHAAVAAGAATAIATVAIAAGSYHLLPRPRLRSAPDDEQRPPPAFLADALPHLAPLLDDAHLRRPEPPRIPMRVSARRLLDAALASARGAQPDATRADLRVELRLSQADADIECDAVEVSEALAAVLDNALRLRAVSPEVTITVHVRGGPSSVTFEVVDHREWPHPSGAGPLPAVEPFREPRRHDAIRPGQGLGLARARLIVERYGGTFITQRARSGRAVQLTFPRRPDRPQRAQA